MGCASSFAVTVENNLNESNLNSEIISPVLLSSGILFLENKSIFRRVENVCKSHYNPILHYPEQ